MKDVVGSNYAHLSAVSDGRTVAVMSVVDNLNKGAAGGAVQWMNRLLGLPETAGLTAPAAGLDLKEWHERSSTQALQPPRRHADYLAPVFAQYPLEVVSRPRACGCNRATAGACSTSTAATRSPRWATATRAGTQALATQAQQLQLPEQRGAAGRARARRRSAGRVSRGLPFESVFFVNSGAEANENALRMALRSHRPQRRSWRVEQQLPRPHRRRRRA